MMPTAFLPVLKLLSRAFPSQTDTDFEGALATLYDASDALIKVCTHVAHKPMHPVSIQCCIYMLKWSAAWLEVTCHSVVIQGYVHPANAA